MRKITSSIGLVLGCDQRSQRLTHDELQHSLSPAGVRLDGGSDVIHESHLDNDTSIRGSSKSAAATMIAAEYE